jgi:hypothetical protein
VWKHPTKRWHADDADSSADETRIKKARINTDQIRGFDPCHLISLVLIGGNPRWNPRAIA